MTPAEEMRAVRHVESVEIIYQRASAAVRTSARQIALKNCLSLALKCDPPDAPRMVLKAYVCGAECARRVQRMEREGTSLLSEIFVGRPPGCQYAVVEVPSTTTPRVWAIDLYDVWVERPATVRIGRYQEYPTVDVAIAATFMEYKE